MDISLLDYTGIAIQIEVDPDTFGEAATNEEIQNYRTVLHACLAEELPGATTQTTVVWGSSKVIVDGCAGLLLAVPTGKIKDDFLVALELSIEHRVQAALEQVWEEGAFWTK